MRSEPRTRNVSSTCQERPELGEGTIQPGAPPALSLLSEDIILISSPLQASGLRALRGRMLKDLVFSWASCGGSCAPSSLESGKRGGQGLHALNTLKGKVKKLAQNYFSVLPQYGTVSTWNTLNVSPGSSLEPLSNVAFHRAMRMSQKKQIRSIFWG